MNALLSYALLSLVLAGLAISATKVAAQGESSRGAASYGASTPANGTDYVDSLGAKVDYWHAEKMPLKVLIVADPRVPNYKPQFKDFFMSACQAWSNASQGKVTFKFVQAAPYDIKVSWTNDVNQLLSKGELGEAAWKNDQDGFFEATIKLLTVAQDASRPINDQEAKLMCLHELGHALGLVNHSPYRGDIMDASIDFNYATPLEQLVLSDRDKKTIFLLYANPDVVLDRLSQAASDPRSKLMRYCFKAEKLLRDEKYDAAYDVLDQALTVDPKCVQALGSMSSCCFEQGMDCYANGDYAKAISRLEKFQSVSSLLKTVDGFAFNSGPQFTEAKEAILRCKAKLQSVPQK